MNAKRMTGIALALAYALVVGLLLLSTDPSHARVPAPGIPDISLVPVVVTPGLDSITDIANAGDERLFIAEKPGRIQVVQADGTASLFLDITDRVGAARFQAGLLGLVFHPDYASNGYFFVHYTDTNDDVHVARFSVGANPDQADPGSEMTVLTVDMPEDNPENFGGDLAFGQDTMLYVALGDGFVSSYPPYENNDSRDLSVLPGKILRLDVDGGTPYAIPADNPFVGQPGAREEVWVYGLRNPWRFSFDSLTADMWIGDVGQDNWEEADLVPAGSGGGLDFGWPCYEGSSVHADPPAGTCDPLPASVMPAVEYDHSGTCAITGGYRYRGSSYPILQGHYLYADWCSGDVWSAQSDGNGGWTRLLLLAGAAQLPATFGEDNQGELLIGGSNGALYRIVENSPPPEITPTPSPSPSPTPTQPPTGVELTRFDGEARQGVLWPAAIGLLLVLAGLTGLRRRSR